MFRRRTVLLAAFLYAIGLGVSQAQEVNVIHHLSAETGGEVVETSITEGGGYLLAGSTEGVVQEWDLGKQRKLLQGRLLGKIVYLSYLSGDTTFVAVTESGQIRKYSRLRGTVISEMQARNDPIEVALSGGRRFLSLVTGSETVEIFDLESERRVGEIEIEKDLENVMFAGFDRAGRQLIAISEQGKALSWNPSTQRLLRTMELGGKSLSGSESKIKVASSRRSTNIFIAGIEEVSLPKGGVVGRKARPGQLVRRDWIVAYNLRTGRRIRRFEFTDGAVQSLALGPGDGHAVAVGSKAKKQASVIDLRAGTVVNKVSTGSEISSVSVSEGGGWLTLGTGDGKVLVKKLDLQSSRKALAGNPPALEPDRAQESSGSPAEKSAEQESPDEASQQKTVKAKTSESGRPKAETRPPIDIRVPQTDMSRPQDVAVVIGVKDYQNQDIPDVRYALRDARVMKKYLSRTLGFRKENVIYVENPGGSALERLFGTEDNPRGQIYDWVKPGKSDVFVYYSGHGAPDPESQNAYLVASDTDPNYLTLNGYPVNQLYENLSKVPAKSVTVVLEACFSGTSEGGAIVQEISPARLSVENPVMAMENGMAFTAGTADQVSTWYTEKRHGLFTYYFLKGLRGHADGNGDHAVTAKEMEKYLTEKVPYRAQRMHSRKQTPQVIGTEKDRVLVQYKGDVPAGEG